jgi:hypothetical protein
LDMEPSDDQKDTEVGSQTQINKKPVYVAFVNKKIEHDFERLKEEKFRKKI